jgi:nucleoside 2-deoxyribosyltransferase
MYDTRKHTQPLVLDTQARTEVTMKPIVYLAGPVTGLSYDRVTTWRSEAKDRLLPHIDCADPMRGFDHLRHETKLKYTYIDHPFTTRRGIMMRDYFDVCRSTALLVNLLDAPDKSAGTIMELAWAFHLRKPVVVIMEPEGNLHDLHPMLMETYDFRVSTLEAGIETARIIVSAE